MLYASIASIARMIYFATARKSCAGNGESITFVDSVEMSATSFVVNGIRANRSVKTGTSIVDLETTFVREA